MLGKWDRSIRVGDTVSAIGLGSQDADGHRLRVRNTAEIVRVKAANNGSSHNNNSGSNNNDNGTTPTDQGNATVTKDEDGNITVQ